MKKTYIFLFLLLFNSLFCQHIQVNDNYTVQQLIKNVLINSPCASVSNITVNGEIFDDGSKSFGYFSKGSSNFPFQDGIILTTGRAKSAPGPNLSPPPTSEGDYSWKGDLDLEQALQISNSHNATIIEFDFIPIANKISFDYIFASEQYLRIQDTGSCSYTDGFAFLLKEKNSSTPYQNLAVLPGTSTPVRSNTVVGNGGRCPAINQQYFGYYNYGESAITYNGQTSVLTAQAKVIPGIVYHIKLVIADQGNPLYDSAVFLKGGSFKVETYLGENRLIKDGNPLCEKEELTLNSSQPNASFFKWYKDGTLISSGSANSVFTITPNMGSGKYSVEATLSGNSCVSTGNIQVEYSAFPEVHNVSIEKCDYNHDGKALFDLNLIKSDIIDNSEEYNFFFYTKNPETDPTATLINNLSNYQNTTNPEAVFVKIVNEYDCYQITEVLLTINSTSISDIVPLRSCDIDGSNSAFFNLGKNFPNMKFFNSLSDLELGKNPLPLSFVSENKTVYGIYYNETKCEEVIEIALEVLPYAGNDVSEEISVCPGSISLETPFSLYASSGYFSYKWNTGETTQSINISDIGTYSVQIYTSENCFFTQTFIVKNAIVPKITEIIVNGSTLEVKTDSNGNSEFSIDEIYWQNSPVFPQLSSGKYTIQIRTADSKCIGESKQAVIFFISNFFSPNGDGINDQWTISGLDVYPETNIKIFDRYGKLLIDVKPNGHNFHWDGTFNGKILPQGTYWYILKLNDSFSLNGWIMIKIHDYL